MPKTTVDLGVVGLQHRGPWNAETIYYRNDLVTYDEDVWTPVHDNVQGPEPVEGEDWTLFTGTASAKAAAKAAADSAAEAGKSRTAADDAAAEAKSWAIGEGMGEKRPDEATVNAKAYAGQAAGSAREAATSVEVIKDNAEAIQAVQDNLGAIISAADNAIAAQSAAEDAATSAETAKEAADRAQSISQGALGYYATAAGLREAYHEGQNGQWAIIGETDTIWVWDEDTTAWVNSGQKTDLSKYYTKDQTDEQINELQRAMNQALTEALAEQTKTINETLTQTTQALTETVEAAKTEALGMVLYLYSAELTAEGWAGSDGTGYTQTASCTPMLDGAAQLTGPAVTEATQLGTPMARPTGVRETDGALQEALNIVNGGTCTPGAGTVTVKVWDQPETDITVYWYGR